MVYYNNKCCVQGCENRTSMRHRLPIKDEKRWAIWKRLISNPKFDALDDKKISANFTICNEHFKNDCFSPGTKRLNANSFPSLHLPGELKEPENNSETSRPTKNAVSTVATDKDPQLIQESHTPTKKSFASEEPVSSLMSPNDTPRKMHVSRREISNSTPKRRRGITKKCRHPLLSEVRVGRLENLTPKAKTLYAHANHFKRLAKYHSRKNLVYQKRLEAANSFSEQNLFKDIKLNPVACSFIISQIKTSKYKPKGRRFLLEDKILALSLYKQSGKGYRLLSKIFNLPTRKVLTDLLAKVPCSPGINTSMFKHLKKTVKSLKPVERFCALIFDEMSLAPNIQWNEAADLIDGFEDYGHRRTNNFADHVLVFMVRGLTKKWKQPVAFMYCKETTSTPELVYNIKEVIKALHSTGLRVLATICDQGATNVAAINTLLQDTRADCLRNERECRFDGFVVDGLEVIPLYDPPHLLKGIRNNMLKYNIHFVEDGVKKIAKWSYVEQLFELDQQQPYRFRSCPKLSKFNVDKKYIKKMKVSGAAQVFSHHAATSMRQIAERPSVGRPYMDPEATDTADLLLFFDELFDSVNGVLLVSRDGKPLRTALTQDSPHLPFWDKAMTTLRSMEFREERTHSKGNVISLKNWLFTIKGIISLWKLMKTLTNLKFLATRSLNQDPIENFFGCIRSHGARQINPTCRSFKSSFKSLLVNNFMALHSVGFNCEEDDNIGALDTLTDFIVQGVIDSDPISLPELDIEQEEVITGEDMCVPAWIAGYIMKRIKHKFNCNRCIKYFTSEERLSDHDLIARREYCKYKRSLMYPSSQFTSMLVMCSSSIFHLLPQICHYRGVGQSIYHFLDEKLRIPLTDCPIHTASVKDFFIKLVCRLVIHFWCKTINGILCGKTKIFPGEKDKIKIAAMKRYNKYSKRAYH